MATQHSFTPTSFLAINAFREECSKISDASFQDELDAMLSFKLQNNPQFDREDHQNDTHLFFRVCFFLAEVLDTNPKVLESWLDIPRTGFAPWIIFQSGGVIDVSVTQNRYPAYCIITQLRLRDGSQLLHPPAWLYGTPLSIPPQAGTPPETVVPNNTLLGGVPGYQATQSWDPSAWFCDTGYQATQHWDLTDPSVPDPLDATGPFKGRAPTPLNEAHYRPRTGLTWMASLCTNDIIDGRSQSLEGEPEASQAHSSMPSHAKPTTAPLRSTPTLQNLNEPPPAHASKANNGSVLSRTPTILNLNGSSASAAGASFTSNGGLSRVPTLPNIMPVNPSQFPSGLVRSSSIRSPAALVRSGSGGLQRSDTVATILASDDFLGAAGTPQVSNVSNTQPSDHFSTPPAQDASATIMDVDAKSSV